jgi:orotate phosphoribosyltransferase
MEAAHIVGSFKLRSGITSHEYFDKYRFESDPDLLFEVTFALKDLVPADVELLAGLELGGIPIATVLGQLTRLPVVFVRKRAKDYGTCRQAEGADISGKRIVVIEDVITSGGQILESVESLRALGAIVDTILCVIDRESGGPQNLRAQQLELRSLFSASQLEDALKKV